MARTAPTLPVNAKMYRHFAVISLTITAGLAMFANSGNREALEEQIAENSAAQKAPPKKIASNFKDNRKGGGSFGEEAGSVSGGGGSTAFYSGDDTVVGPELVPGSTPAMVPGDSTALPDGEFNGLPPGMTPEEARAWRARHGKQSAPVASEPSASDIAAIMAASKARAQMGPGS